MSCDILSLVELNKLKEVLLRIGETELPNKNIKYIDLFVAFNIQEQSCGMRSLYNAIDKINVEENTDIQDNNNEISDGKESDVIRGQASIIGDESERLEEEAVKEILNNNKYIRIAEQQKMIQKSSGKSKYTTGERIRNFIDKYKKYGFYFRFAGGRKSRKSRKFRKSRKSRKSRKTRK